MKWWVKALIASVVWVVLVIGITFIHTEVVLKDKITKAQDGAISEMYGRVAVSGLIPIWIIFQLVSRKRK